MEFTRTDSVKGDHILWANETQTLWIDRNRDTWQLPVISSDGAYCGNVVAQIVDPQQCLVRYFVVFSRTEGRQFLIPSATIEEIDTVLHCTSDTTCLRKLPAYVLQIPRQLEQEVHLALGEDPYWL